MKQVLELHKGFAFALLLAALVLLALATAGLEGKLWQLSRPAASRQTENEIAVNSDRQLYAGEEFGALLAAGQKRDVFATTYFIKPKPPERKPDPARTRTVALTYLGTISGSQGSPAVFVRVDDKVQRLAAGAAVIDDWAIAELNANALVLTNATSTNRLGFRETFRLEVPVR